MPTQNAVASLQNITTESVSSILASSIAQHYVYCPHCKVSSIETCKNLGSLKFGLKDACLININQKAHDILTSKKIYELCPNIIYDGPTKHEQSQRYYLLILAFILAQNSDDFAISFEITPLMYLHKDSALVSKLLNCNTKTLRVGNILNMENGATVWDGLHLRENGITVLEIHQQVMESWDGASLRLFGRYCKHLKTFSFECGIILSEDVFLKFCFSDYPDNSVKNACCYTIETVLLSLFFDSLYNGYYIFLENMPNLKHTGNSMHFDTFLEHIESEGKPLFPTKLENIILAATSLELLDSIHFMCPKLKSIACTDEWDFLLSYSPMAGSLESMEFSLKTATEFNIFLNKAIWTNLRHLVIYIDAYETEREPIKCCISEIIQQCPNLEKLDLEPVILLDVLPQEFGNCVLSNVRLMLHEIPNLTWLVTLAPTVKTLALNASLLESEFLALEDNIVETFLDISFPLLEELCIALSQNQPMSISNCRSLIYHIPNLKQIHATNMSDAEILMTEVTSRNLDLNVGWMYS